MCFIALLQSKMKEVQLSVLKTTGSVSAGFSGVIIAYVNIKDHLKGTSNQLMFYLVL